jgi:23S rRNA pseudouridine2457 synthase
MPTLLLLNKPFRVLSQFTDEKTSAETPRDTLANYIQQKGVYPAGRLDYDSEGLLLLTDDGALQQHIANPKYKLPKTYWVQVEGEANPEAIEQLRHGVMLKDGKTQAANVELIDEPSLWPRTPPVRFRQSIPTHWLSITISEGRNRQVRRMTASVGLPTLRLVRIQIGDWRLDTLQPGEHTQITAPPVPATKTTDKPKKNHRRRKTP